MKIIVVGLGQKGIILADCLAKEGHDVVAVDISKEQIETVTNKYSVSGICGSGVSKEVLLKAGADTADVILALTPIDEVNLMICKIARDLGTRYAGARLFQPELSVDKEYLEKEFMVNYLINPKLETANEIVRHIGLPGHVRADAFFSDAATMIRITVEPGIFPKEKMTVEEIRDYFNMDMLIGTVLRKNEITVPSGNFVIENGDVLGIVASNDVILQVMEKLNLVHKQAKNIFIVGGGDVAYYLGRQLCDKKLKVTILDNDKTRCMKIAEKLPAAKVSYADGLQEEVLMSEGLRDADTCISLTGHDENNLVISLFAWSCGIPSIITRINSSDYERLLNRVKIDITISPNVITTNGMLGFVRDISVYNEMGNDIQALHLLDGGKAEALEFIAYDGCRNLNIPFKAPEFKIKKQVLVALLIRGDRTIVPSGHDCIKAGDRVVVITKGNRSKALNRLNDIFE